MGSLVAVAEGIDGFEAFGFFVDACGRAPPPGLVHEGAVRGVHEADDAVVDVAGEIGGEVRGAEVLGEFWEGRGWVGVGRHCLGGDAAGAGCGDVDPGVAVALGDGEGVGEDLCGLEGVVGGE